MDKEAATGKLQNALADMKRKLQREREEAELLTQTIAKRGVGHQFAEESQSKRLKLELELATTRKELAEQKEAALNLAQQLATVRDAGRMQMQNRDSGPSHRKLEEELSAAQDKLREQQEAAESLIQRVVAERDESQTRLHEAQARLDEEAGARRQLEESQRSTEEAIRNLTAERDESRGQLDEVMARIQGLEEDWSAAQEQFSEQRKAAVLAIQQLQAEQAELETARQKLEAELASAQAQLQNQTGWKAAAEEAIRDIQSKTQQVLGLLESAAPQAASQEQETQPTASG